VSPTAGAFLDQSSSLLGRHEAKHEPLAVLLFILSKSTIASATPRVMPCCRFLPIRPRRHWVLFARIGGEEFASCLPVGDMDEAYAIAERVRRNFVAAAARFGREQFLPSVSVGIALGRESGLAVGALLSVADRALYRAKELGRNRVEMEMQDGEAAASAPSIVPINGSERAVPGAHSSSRRWRAAL
jgi:hypothetical protein